MKSSTMDLITANQEIFNRLIYKAVTDQEYMKSTPLSRDHQTFNIRVNQLTI